VKGLVLAASLTLATATVPPQPVAATVTVAIDVTAEAADAALSTNLRVRMLETSDPRAAARYVSVTPDAIRLVPADERSSFRRTTFVNPPPRYNGVALTVDDAVEILRGNQAVRDAIIQRECAASPRLECGGSVHAAATTRAADAEEATRRKLLRLVEVARAYPATTLVLITAGWPYRDEGRVGLRQAVADLSALGTSLIVVRAPGRSAYRGLVRDASEVLAARLSAVFTPLTSSDDADHVATTLAAGEVPRLVTPVEAAAHAPDAATGSATDPDPAGAAGLPPGLVAAGAYVEQFERTFSSVVWHERYRQEVRTERRFASSGARSTVLTGRRTLDSEMFFLWLPLDASWITVRDVVAVDGRTSAAADRRLQALLAGNEVSTRQLRVLAVENGRHDIGHIQRSFTEPTLVLLFLDPHYRQRFSFTPGAAGGARGRRMATWDFVELGRPTVIRNRDQDMPARGSLTVDTATGRILETRLELRVPGAMLTGEATVRFAAHPRFDVLVPIEMRERYESASGEHITTVAAYADFRRFETAGRLVRD
jgi:hypothetical protein